MEYFKRDSRKVPRLLAGLVILALGIYLTRLSQFGLAPWPVLHDGLENVTGIGFGFITQIVGIVILLFSIITFRTKVGIGTILNVLLVGPIIELFDLWYTVLPNQLWLEVMVFICGLLLMTFGRSLYISSELGQGPRDGLFVGLARTTRFQVKYIKLTIELIVCTIGFILGGTVGFGTILVVLFSGYLVQFYFRILQYNPKTSIQYSVLDYFKKKESTS